MKAVFIAMGLFFLTINLFGQFNRHHRPLTGVDSTVAINGYSGPLNEKGERIKAAEFRGGLGKLARFLSKHLKYPTDARQNDISGTVYVAFIVDKEGNIKAETVRVLKPLWSSCDQEALRVVRKFPKWSPALNLDTNENVETYFVIPVMFRLESK